MKVFRYRVLVVCGSATLACLTVSAGANGTLPAQAAQTWAGEKAIATWYVSASAQPGGNGSRETPFESLIFAQGWSAPGDMIVILPSPLSTPPLDFGIRLQDGQTLIGEGPSVVSPSSLTAAPRITNTRNVENSGDAIVLADHVTVRNITVVNPYRVGIYGSNVTGVHVSGNNVSGHNTSCAVGLHIFPFSVLGFAGVTNGWAGIMIDNTVRQGDGVIDGNYVHDATCGDGIDIRLGGTAAFDAVVAGNRVESLQQGTDKGLMSVLAIGMQTGERSRLNIRIDGNSEINIGSPAADPEGIFANIGGMSTADIDINHNTADNIHGGASSNGMELILAQGPSTARMKIANSTFTNVNGDILEELTFGTNESVHLELDRVTASHAAVSTPTNVDFETQTQLRVFNTASCLVLSNTSPNFLPGGNNSMSVVVRNSIFSDCETGILAGARRNQRELSVEIENSTLTGNRSANLYVKNLDPVTDAMAAAQRTASGGIPAFALPGASTQGLLGRLDVRVRRSNLSGSKSGSSVYVYAVPGTILDGRIDLGDTGPALGSAGFNDLSGSKPAIKVTGADVIARRNWWGRASGPSRADIVLENGATLIFDPALTSPSRQ